MTEFGEQRVVRHSVLCITYNQESYVEQAVTSLFRGRVWPDEVIIADDCSRDGTLGVLTRLRDRYPDRITLICNPVNLGIFDNLNQLARMPTGDVIHLLAGDDWFEPGMFERMNEEIVRRHLLPARQRFMITPDAYSFNGTSLVRRTNRRLANSSLFKRVLRQTIFVMPVGMSRALFQHYPVFRSDVGLWADYLHLLTYVQFCEAIYFIDNAFPVYRLGSGISSRTPPAQLSKSFLKVLTRVRTELEPALDRSDTRFLRYLGSKHEMIADGSLGHYVRFLLRFARNVFNGAKRSDLEECLGALIRRWFPNGVRRRAGRGIDNSSGI